MDNFINYLNAIEKAIFETKTPCGKKIKVTEKEAAEMLKSKLICMKLDNMACIGQGCNRDCDNCKYMYGQGTTGEFEQALSLAIPLLIEAANSDKTTSNKTYEDGLNDMYELIKKLFLQKKDGGYSSKEFDAIFSDHDEILAAESAVEAILLLFSSKEIIEKVKAYEDKKVQLKVGDVVKQSSTDKEFLIIAESGNTDFPFDVIDLDTFTVDSIVNNPNLFTKTGKTMDLKALFGGLKS